MIDEKASLDKQMLDKLIWKMSRVDLCKHFTNVINLQQCQTNHSLTEPLSECAALTCCLIFFSPQPQQKAGFLVARVCVVLGFKPRGSSIYKKWLAEWCNVIFWRVKIGCFTEGSRVVFDRMKWARGLIMEGAWRPTLHWLVSPFRYLASAYLYYRGWAELGPARHCANTWKRLSWRSGRIKPDQVKHDLLTQLVTAFSDSGSSDEMIYCFYLFDFI